VKRTTCVEEAAPAAVSEEDDRAALLAERFAIKRRVGAGSFGVVYEAFDKHRNTLVALKHLTHLDPTSVWRFKTEFRAMADVSHPNLVVLNELFVHQGSWFFTMDLVPGVDFVRHCRRSNGESEACDVELLRPALTQLVEGVHACHTAGYVHRDIKPANALVCPDGKVVLLDFGLLAATNASGVQAKVHNSFSGTPAYMAPELLCWQPASHASDWYAVGVMLYEALTGQIPFGPSLLASLPFRRAAQKVAESLDGAPADLRELCLQLLEPDPSRRPSYPAIGAVPGVHARDVDALPVPPLTGREAAFAELRRAFDELGQGRPVLARVRGPSGIGKTSVVRAFLRSLAAVDAICVLEGRCREHESVPFNAFDSLVDELVERLVGAEPNPIDAVPPQLLGPLANVFPSFGRLDAFDRVQPEFVTAESIDLRERAFAGLRAVLASLAQHSKLVIFLDDLQWADRDSVAMLRALFIPPGDARRPLAALPVLFIASHREDDADVHGMLAALDELTSHPSLTALTLALGPLPRESAQTLLRAVHTSMDPALAGRLYDESGGHPYFLLELARAARTRATKIGGVSLDMLLLERISQLPAAAQRIMETAAVAGRAIELPVLLRCVEPVGFHDPIAPLRRARLLKSHSGRAFEMVDVYHDRIREAVLGAIPENRLALLHRRLAEELEVANIGEPEELMLHLRAAGDSRRAADYAELAGDRALRSLGFELAARLYLEALDLSAAAASAAGDVDEASDRASNHRRQRKLGDAFLYAGRGTDCAQAYLATAGEASPAEALRLRRLAAEQLLRSGRIEEGLRVMEGVLNSVQLELPRTLRGALLWLLIGRLYLRWRGFRFSERAARHVAERDLARIDVCWSARIGLSLVNYVLYAAFESRHLLLALNAGEPYRIARALIAEGGFLGSSGKPLATRSSAILARGEQLAERIGDPYLIASGRMTRGANEYFLGRWRSAVEHLQCAERMFREQCHGVAWDVSAAHLFTLSALRYLGPMEDVRRQLEAHVERADQLGDLYASVTLSMHLGTLVWLAADEPARARAHLEATQRRWPYRSFQVQEWLAWSAGLDLALYEEDPGRARQLLEELEPEFRNSFLDRVQLIRVEWRYRRALVWLHVKGPERAKALRRARAETRRIRAEGLPWTRGLATLLSAALAAQQEQKQRAVVLCREACALLAAADMPLHASVARYRWSELVGGEEGVTLKARAEFECRARGIRRPARWANIYCPTLLHAPDPSADRLPS
jgi:hypothetical protein